MDKFKKKTFANSYLFNFDKDTYNKIHKELAEFIIKSNRIDKNSEAFSGIIEETKRFQNTSVLYSVLLNENVLFCINNTKELPAAFKVFEANNVKDNDGYKIFIDCTGLIKEVNGYYVCKKIDVFFTYLYEAMNLLLYSVDPVKYISNSQITLSATEAYVSLFNYIIDYKRIIGYAQNKQKISYLTALFFMHNMMGKEIDNYTKNIACKVAKLSASDTRAFELYYADDSFDNLDSFITMLATTFKLKGFTTEVFVGQWIYSFGKGTEYATELFTSFANMLIATYCGAYVVHQKTIEKCCGSSMITFVNSFTKVALSLFDVRALTMETSEFEKTFSVDPKIKSLQEKISLKNKKPDNIKFDKEIIKSKSKTKKTIDNLVKYYKSIEKEDKIGDELIKVSRLAFKSLKKYNEKDEYESGTLEIILKEFNKYKDTSKLGRSFLFDINREIELISTKMRKNVKPVDNDEKDMNKRMIEAYKELNKCKSLL